MFMSTRYKKKDPAWRGRPLFSVDDSLAKLFECLTIEYCCSKLISPKWKNFRNQKLKFEHKTRLNNAIWRAWHIQYKLNSKARFCQFEAPFSDQNVHSTPQAVILEGRYWKKRLDTVSYEYLKWRKLYSNPEEESSSDGIDIKKIAGRASPKPSSPQKKARSGDVVVLQEPKMPFTSSNGLCDEEMMIDSLAAVSHLPDTLFSSLDYQKRSPNSGNGFSCVPFTDISDTIQPTLDQLNPCFDELMENFDFLTSALWNDPQSSALYTLAEEQQAKESIEAMSVDQQLNTFPNSFGKDQNFSMAEARKSEYNVASNKQQFNACAVRSESVIPQAQQPVPAPSDVDQAATSQQQQQRKISASHNLSNSNVKQSPESQVSEAARDELSLRERAGSASDSATQQLKKSSYTTYSTLPPKLQAPHLAACLQAGSKQKPNAGEQDAHSGSTSNPASKDLSPSNHKVALPKQAGSSKFRRGNLPRNRSDSSLSQMESQVRLKDIHGTGKDRRRGSHKNADAPNRGNIQRNHSDSSLSSLSHSPRRNPHILPKGLVTAMPLQQSIIMHAPVPICPSNMYPGQGPTLLVHPQPPGNNEPGKARLYMPKSTATSQHMNTTSTSQAQPPRSISSVTRNETSISQGNTMLPILQTGQNRQGGSAPEDQLPQAGIAPLPMFTDNQLTALMQVLEKGKEPEASRDTANQVAYLEQLQQQLNAAIRMQQQRILSSQPSPISLQKDKEPQPMEGVTSPFNPITPPSSVAGNTTSIADQPVTSQGILQQAFNQNSVTYILPAQSRSETMQVDEPSVTSNQISSPVSQSSHSVSPRPTIVSLGEGVYVQLDGNNPGSSSMNHIVGIPNAFAPASSTTAARYPSSQGNNYDTVMSKSPLGASANATSPTTSLVTSTFASATPTSSSTMPSNQSAGKGGRQAVASPSPSPATSISFESPDGGVCKKENRRRSHITAEQRRRCSIKAALDEFLEIIPSLKNQHGSKISKAMILQKATGHIVHLQSERTAMSSKLDILKAEIKELNIAIQVCQQQLPDTGASMSHRKEDVMNESFIKYVRSRINEDRSFWIFGIMLRPLFESFRISVSTVTIQEFLSSVFKWLEESCSLPALRPVMSASLRQFSSCTSILTDPSQVAAQATLALNVDDPTTLDRDPAQAIALSRSSSTAWENAAAANQAAWSFDVSRTVQFNSAKQNS